MKVLGLRLNAKKNVLSPLQRTTYLGVVWDSTRMQARTSPARIESILTEVWRMKEGQSLTVKQFQRLLGLMAAASNVIPIGLLYTRPLQWWHKTKRFSPWGNSIGMIKVTRRCQRALDMWRKPWFLFMGADVLGRQGMDASPRGGEANLECVWPGLGVPFRYSGDSAMSPLVLSSSSSSAGVGCYGTDMAEASSVHLSPDHSAPGRSDENAPGRVQSTSGSTVLAGAEYGSQTVFLSSMTPHGRFPSGGISSHRQGSFTPARSYGSCGYGLWGGAAHSFRSLNRGCWDHTPIQSSLNEKTVRPEVETFHFMVRRPTVLAIIQFCYWMNPHFRTNRVSQWFSDPFILRQPIGLFLNESALLNVFVEWMTDAAFHSEELTPMP